MTRLVVFVFSGFLFFNIVSADIRFIIKDLHVRKDLQHVIIDVLNGLAKKSDVTCVTAITDDVYLNIFEGGLFKRTYPIPFLTVVVDDREDLLSPNFDTLESITRAKEDGCNVYLIILANGLQATRLLKFGDRYRLLDTRVKFIMLHDIRLFHSDFHYLWTRIVNVIFIKHHKKVIGKLKSNPWFDVSTVPYPNPIKSVLVPRRVDIWRNGRFQYGRELFYDKTSNLNGEVLRVVYLEHVPSVMVTELNESNKVSGVEVEENNLEPGGLHSFVAPRPLNPALEILTFILITDLNENHVVCGYQTRKNPVGLEQILNTLSQKMNFKPKLYQSLNANFQKWGEKQANGSYSGLLGEMVGGKADIAIGNLQYTPYHLDLTDLSIPYTSQCWTFLTPEALTDNSWKTLILPFKLYMWIAVLLVLLVTGAIFYCLAHYYLKLVNFRELLKKEKCHDVKPVGLYLFGEITNSILYTYGMLLFVSLPKLPTGWSIRLLTGWYWLYCILLVVSYRASMTAILANPAPRVTIDTLKELVDSKLSCGGWGSETKKFFEESFDEKGQKICEKFETINDPDEAAKRIARGVFAYYDSADFLKYLSVKRKFANKTIEIGNFTMNYNQTIDKQMERSLHIMLDCVVNAPISVGFHKNSPLKPLADIYLKQIVEVGLVEKWLNDAMYKIRSLDTSEEEIKALINLRKMYCAFIALAIGYTLSSICFLGEYIHWNLIVKRDPTFDKYNLDKYYRNKNEKQ